MDNQYLERYRRESYILDHNRNATYMNPSVVPGNLDNLKSHLLRIRGNSDGNYFDSHFKPMPSTLTILKEKQKELEQKWEQYRTDQLNLGNKRPQKWPPEMQEEKEKLNARTQVCTEEISWLEQKLQEAMEQQKKAKPSLLVHPRNWGSFNLKDNVVISAGPWSVSPNEEGLLCIDDEDSPYHSMPVWRFKSEILKPMSQEFVLRHK